jgi:predicted dehydrogenase
MNQRCYRTAIVGFGKIGAEYADDPLMARHYPVATHAQALAGHSAFEWWAVVDPRPESRRLARDRWGIASTFATVNELAQAGPTEVAVLATPPEARLEAIEALPDLRAVIVEKPLGRTIGEAQAFVDACRKRDIHIQVNYWRRADDGFRELASGGLNTLVGNTQAVFGVYGNGLRNNGSHMIDFCRMLFGEIADATALAGIARRRTGPLEGDIDVPFSLAFESGLCALFQPIDFSDYRENGLDIWGSRGRLQIVQEGLRTMHASVRENRAMRGEKEVASDAPYICTTSVGNAFRRLYDHTALMLDGGADAVCSAESALRTEAVVEDVFASALPIGDRRASVAA